MPAITKRNDGRYETHVEMPNGKRKSVYGKTRKACREKAKALEAKIALGVRVDVKRYPMTDLFDAWIENVARKTYKALVFEQHERHIKTVWIPRLGACILQDINADSIQPHINELEETLAYNTVRNIRSTLSKVFDYAVQRRYIAYNPVKIIPLKRKSERYIPRVFTFEEALAFDSAVQLHEWGLSFQLALRTGMRQGEILGLAISDLNFEAETVAITGNLQWQRKPGESERQAVRDTPKNTASAATITMPASLVAPLRAHVAQQRARFPQNIYVFTTNEGEPINRYEYYAAYKKVLKEGNLPNIRFHDLRHTCASLLIDEGEDVKVVQEQLRHKHVTTTLQIYAHVLPDRKRRAANKLDTLMQPPAVGPVVKSVVKNEEAPSDDDA